MDQGSNLTSSLACHHKLDELMPSNRQQAFIDIGLGAIPVAMSVISLTMEAEAVPAFFAIAAGVGAGLSLAAAPALILAAVAVAVVDDKTVSEIRTSVGQLGKVTSPGFVFSIPFGAAVTPQDPTLFAGAVGPGLDLFAGALSPSGFDQFQAAQQSFIGFGTWFSDMQKFAASGSKPSASVAPSGSSRESSGGYFSSDESGTNNSAGSDWNNGGFAHDSAIPGGNETPDFSESSPTPDSTRQSEMMDLPGYVTGLGAERSAGAQAEDEVEAQNNAAEAASLYSDEESQAAEDAATAAEQGSDNSNVDEDPDNDDDDPDDD